MRCKQCGAVIDCDSTTQSDRDTTPAELPKSLPYDVWPRWAKLIAKRRQADDIGVGSTVRRIAERRGGEQFKRIAEWLGIPCGCTTREERWNRLYPYNKQSGFTEAKE